MPTSSPYASAHRGPPFTSGVEAIESPPNVLTDVATEERKVRVVNDSGLSRSSGTVEPTVNMPSPRSGVAQSPRTDGIEFQGADDGGNAHDRSDGTSTDHVSIQNLEFPLGCQPPADPVEDMPREGLMELSSVLLNIPLDFVEERNVADFTEANALASEWLGQARSPADASNVLDVSLQLDQERTVANSSETKSLVDEWLGPSRAPREPSFRLDVPLALVEERKVADLAEAKNLVNKWLGWCR